MAGNADATGNTWRPLTTTPASTTMPSWAAVATVSTQRLYAGQQYTMTYKWNPDTLSTEAVTVPSFMESQYIPFTRPAVLTPGDTLSVSFRPSPGTLFTKVLAVNATERAIYIGAWVHQVGEQFVATLVKEGER